MYRSLKSKFSTRTKVILNELKASKYDLYAFITRIISFKVHVVWLVFFSVYTFWFWFWFILYKDGLSSGINIDWLIDRLRLESWQNCLGRRSSRRRRWRRGSRRRRRRRRKRRSRFWKQNSVTTISNNVSPQSRSYMLQECPWVSPPPKKNE